MSHRTKLNEFEKIEIVQSMFSKHNESKLELSKRKMGEQQISGNWLISKLFACQTGSPKGNYKWK